MRKYGRFLFFLVLSGCLMVLNFENVSAGEITSIESAVVSAVSQVFRYNGDSYQALPEYIEEVRAYLSEDDVDLTEADRDEILGMIEANVPTAIEEGYLVKIGGTDTEHVEEGDSVYHMEKPESSGKKGKKAGKKNGSSNQNDGEEEDKENKEDSGETGGDTEEEPKTGKENNQEKDQEETQEGRESAEETDREKEEIEEDSRETGKESEDKENLASSNEEKEEDGEPVKKLELKGENALDFWYQADKERRQKENNFIYMLAAGICGIVLVLYIGRMIYRHYALYLSHKKASGRWKPQNLTDMHCHLLPKVDDGAINMDMTKELLRQEIENGVDTILFTPHFKRGKSRFNNEKLREIFENVKKEALQLNPKMKLYLGEELYYDNSLCNAIEEGRALKLNETNYVLVEFSPEVEYGTIHKACQNLVMSGVSPVLAHVERYPALISKTAHLTEIHEMGVYYQMNVVSILGSNFSGRVYRQRKLLADGWIDFIGSDSHDDKRRNPKFKKAWKELLRLCDDEMIERIMWENPAKLLAGDDIEL